MRTAYSSPPIHGAKLVAEVLGDPALSAQYYKECASMATRIKEMRSLLAAALKKAGSTLDWSHVVSQIGMFAFTGLTPEEVNPNTTNLHPIYPSTHLHRADAGGGAPMACRWRGGKIKIGYRCR